MFSKIGEYGKKREVDHEEVDCSKKKYIFVYDISMSPTTEMSRNIFSWGGGSTKHTYGSESLSTTTDSRVHYAAKALSSFHSCERRQGSHYWMVNGSLTCYLRLMPEKSMRARVCAWRSPNDDVLRSIHPCKHP